MIVSLTSLKVAITFPPNKIKAHKMISFTYIGFVCLKSVLKEIRKALSPYEIEIEMFKKTL